MPLPRLQYAFLVIGSLKIACIIIFTFFLLTCGYLSNRYLGMYAHSRVLHKNPSNLTDHEIDVKRKEVTLKAKASFTVGSISSIYFVLSIYGLLGIIMKEVYFLLAPMIMLPIAAFLVLLTVFFDLEVTEGKGFLYFYVFAGSIAKLIVAGATVYCFLVVYSHFMEMTEQPLPPPTSTSAPPSLPTITSNAIATNDDTVAPTHKTIAPIDIRIGPIDNTIAPIDNTITPIEGTIAPIDDTITPTTGYAD